MIIMAIIFLFSFFFFFTFFSPISSQHQCSAFAIMRGESSKFVIIRIWTEYALHWNFDIWTSFAYLFLFVIMTIKLFSSKVQCISILHSNLEFAWIQPPFIREIDLFRNCTDSFMKYRNKSISRNLYNYFIICMPRNQQKISII